MTDKNIKTRLTKITYTNGNVYKGDFKYKLFLKIPYGEGKDIVVNKETKKPLYSQVYNKNGIMENVRYFFDDSNGNRCRMVINYNEINRALNRNEINKVADLKKYIKIYDKDNNEVENYDNIEELIKNCAQYQMQTRLKGNSDKLDNENRMNGSDIGLQDLIILSKFVNNIEALKRTRFCIKQNDIDWPKNIYKNKESFLNSFGITTYDPPKDNSLTPIGTLLKNGVDHICTGMTTTKGNHAVSGIIDLLKDSFYIYDSSRVITLVPDKVGDLGGLQSNCQFYNHPQQKLGSCWYHASCSNIVTAEHPEIIDKIRKNEIKPVLVSRKYKKDNNKFNHFEILQMLELQKVADYLEVERLGKDSKRMMHQIVNEPAREAIKMWADNYFKNHENLNDLEDKLNAYKSLLVICHNEDLSMNELDTKKVNEILSRRAKISHRKTKPIQPQKEVGIFSRILSGIKKIFGIKENNASNPYEVKEADKGFSNTFGKATEINQESIKEEINNKKLETKFNEKDGAGIEIQQIINSIPFS